jgi:hypothetical protein
VARQPLPRIVWLVWALLALVALEVLATYWRLPAHDLYHVSGNGPVGGLSRVLVLLDFPFALVAVPLAGLAADRLATPATDAVAVAATVLCAIVALPGVVDQDNLDARWVNAAPAAGVALALGLCVLARGAVPIPRLPLDLARIALAAILLVAGIPWLLAELGVSVSDVPLLGRIFLGHQIRAVLGQETLAAVHLGHHHGADGAYLAFAALLLTRALPSVRRPRLRATLSAYLALLLAYALANALQDGWTEQVVKRGWTHHAIPSLLRPDANFWWAGIVAAAALVELLLLRPERSGSRALADPEPVERALHLDKPDEGTDER